MPRRGSLVRGRPFFPVRGGGSSWSAEVFAGVGGVADGVHGVVGEVGGDEFGRLAGQGDLPRVARSPQSVSL
ncbi:hypothetical protein ABH925_001294 [Streptacidiphilus sp. EB129]|jgi:hypothetical protein